MKKGWYRAAFRRNVVDMHIPDWDERFLSQFDPDAYVRNLVTSRVRSAVVYAHSHVGLCTFPTRVATQHRGLNGRDILSELIERCHEREISVVVYLSLIHDRWASDQHPEWRIIMANGKAASEGSRHGFLCLNSPYRDYVASLTEEICSRYDFEGIRFDMTFWPVVCYCRHCEERFEREIGGELPRTINWTDRRWVSFQRKREEWLAEFAALLTGTVRRAKPGASVEHQASTYTASWVLGVTERLVEHNDFLQGDFYGDALEGSFVRKLLYNLTPNLPFGFETSISVELADHTSLKSQELLTAKAFGALADGGAFVFIDGIDPVGTLNPRVYERMGSVFEETERYDPYRGGEMVQDVAVYFSAESTFDFADNGKAVDAPGRSGRLLHLEAALGACRALVAHHVPYGVIGRRNLDRLDRHQVLILPNVLMMNREEADAIRAWVSRGGSLYASRDTSLTTTDGERLSDFLLADLFGVSCRGETGESVTYVAPTREREPLFDGHTAKYPLFLRSVQTIVAPNGRAEVLATISLPYSDPKDPDRYASIHSNPPGVPTEHAAVVFHRYGNGKVIYAAGDIETSANHGATFINLIRLIASPFSFEADAPACVEVTLFHQPDRARFLVNLLNFQHGLPNVPVDGARVRLRTDERLVRRVLLLPDETELPYAMSRGFAEFAVPRIETFRMIAVDCSSGAERERLGPALPS